MNAVKIIENANYSLEYGTITSGEYDKIVKPLEDVEPIKHGHWIKDNNNYVYHYVCSNCREASIDETNYCSNCGAKMDEVTDDV